MTGNASQCAAITHQLEAIDTRMLRGQALADYVEEALNTDKTASQIAAAASYRHVERCAQNLARARYAPLARRLIARHHIDLLNPPEIVPDPEPVTRMPVRPPRDRDELLDELKDMSACGLTYDHAAERLNVTTATLRHMIYNRHISHAVAPLFPEAFPRVTRVVRLKQIVADLCDMAEAGESWREAARKVGYEKPQSLASRLSVNGYRKVLAKFGPGVWAA